MAFGLTPVNGFPPPEPSTFPQGIQFQQAGVNVGTRAVDTVNFVTGPALSVTVGVGESANVLTVAVPDGSGGAEPMFCDLAPAPVLDFIDTLFVDDFNDVDGRLTGHFARSGGSTEVAWVSDSHFPAGAIVNGALCGDSVQLGGSFYSNIAAGIPGVALNMEIVFASYSNTNVGELTVSIGAAGGHVDLAISQAGAVLTASGASVSDGGLYTPASAALTLCAWHTAKVEIRPAGGDYITLYVDNVLVGTAGNAGSGVGQIVVYGSGTEARALRVASIRVYIP